MRFALTPLGSSPKCGAIQSRACPCVQMPAPAHALADVKGRLIAILLTGGEAHDCPVAERLIRRVKPSKRMLGDKAYDSAELREDLHERGTKPVIPNRCNREQPFRKRIYKLRWRIESAFNRLNDFRRIATRYDRLARNYLASVCLAAALVWWI
jgi:transposase